MKALFTLIKRSFTSFGTDRCATLSAAIAYRTVFSLFPLALVGVSLLGFFVSDEAARDQVIEGIASVITLGPEGEEALENALAGISSTKGVVGLIGLATALWSASGLFGELRTALNSIWDVDRPRPMLRAKVQDLWLLSTFGGLLALSTASTGMLTAARDAGAQWLGPLADVASPVFVALLVVAPFLLTLAAFLCLYRLAPHARLAWRDVLPAALIAALFFEFGKNLLTFYISHMGNLNALAGSLGAAILFLVFVYYAAQVILFAAEFAKHRMLVAAGTLPATDPAQTKAHVSLGERLKLMVAHLWTVDETHHDKELPYAPGRQDPATNRPTNTREEVMMKWDDAAKAAGTAGSDEQMEFGANQRYTAAKENGATPSVTVIGGEILRHGTQLAIESETKVTPIVQTTDMVVTRNGKEAKLSELKPGDWATITLDRDGTIIKLDASDQVSLKRTSATNGGSLGDVVGTLGTLGSVAIGAVKQKSSGSDGDDENTRQEAGGTGRPFNRQ